MGKNSGNLSQVKTCFPSLDIVRLEKANLLNLGSTMPRPLSTFATFLSSSDILKLTTLVWGLQPQERLDVRCPEHFGKRTAAAQLGLRSPRIAIAKRRDLLSQTSVSPATPQWGSLFPEKKHTDSENLNRQRFAVARKIFKAFCEGGRTL